MHRIFIIIQHALLPLTRCGGYIYIYIYIDVRSTAIDPLGVTQLMATWLKALLHVVLRGFIGALLH